MNIVEEIAVNKYGQNLISINDITDKFILKILNDKKEYLSEIVNLIQQSKAKDDDISLAIKNSNLKSTYTPCVLIKKGLISNVFENMISLPENELQKVLILFLSLFKIAYERRYKSEKNNPNKWWYWDLSDEENIKKILRTFNR